ncbi:activator of basal transcription 1-like [Artemia franciscana]|uniref:Activator of basal transcription 1 n=1 Tax=Artemia franciscana TaxID=6661 RepID=A0AA88HNL0_ARTSF|nr:hypothetical protein QYM36_008830 [Artemia franciscana]
MSEMAVELGNDQTATSEVMDMEESSSLLMNKDKSGIIYLSVIPPKMNVSMIKEYFSQFGEVNRVFLQPGKVIDKKKKKKYSKSFEEGWVEFVRKSRAKKVALMLNNQRVGATKKSKHYDFLWNIKYLSHFKWAHLNERLAYEKAAHQNRVRNEIYQTKKETDFFKENVAKNDIRKRKKKQKAEEEKEHFIPSDSVKLAESYSETAKGKEDRIGLLKSLFAPHVKDSD